MLTMRGRTKKNGCELSFYDGKGSALSVGKYGEEQERDRSVFDAVIDRIFVCFFFGQIYMR